jgi:tetratricopeptide (TPR) repeat protein
MLGATLFVSCTSGNRSAVEGAPVLKDVVALVRGSQRDVAEREFVVDGDATFVVIAHEDDGDVTLRLSHGGVPGIAPAAVEVESSMLDAGIELAVFDAPRGSRLKVSLSGPRDFEKPRQIPLEVFRYDRKDAVSPPAAARIAALRAWTAATDSRLSGADIPSKSIPQIDVALTYLESPGGDPLLAAWARILRSRFNYRQMADLKTSLTDARLAVRGFTALGDTRSVARGSLIEAVVLIEIATDGTAKNPSADEAAREATRLLTKLRDEPTLSAFERARCVGYLAANEFNIYQWNEAETSFLAALSMYDDVGYRHGRRQILTNLGVLAAEVGDYATATRYFDRLMPEIDEVADKTQRVQLLYNAAINDIFSGNTDRGIERLLLAQNDARTLGLNQYEFYILHGLGRAYWEQGDIAQAATLLREALKLRRTLDAGVPLLISLRANGVLARGTGDLETAIALHRELESLATTQEMKLCAAVELALDYLAASDYERTIEVARHALSLRIEQPDYYQRSAIQLTLADALLSRPRRSSEALREATSLIQDALGSAARRSDIPLEIAARRLLAQSLVARLEYRTAREEYERAIALIFKYRSAINNPELRAATLDHEQKTFHGYVELLMRDVVHRGPGEPLPVGEAEENALRTLERARALRFDSTAVSELDAGTQSQVVDLLTQMAGKRVRIAALQEREPIPTRELELLQLDIARLRAEVDHLRAAASRGASGTTLSKTVGEVWPLLPKGVTQLSYALDTGHPFLWVRDASGIRSTMLGTRAEEVDLALKALAGATRSSKPARVEEVLTRLSHALIPAGTLSEDTSILEVVADGDVIRIPFAALTSPEGRAGRLSESRSIVMITSMFEIRERPKTSQLRALRFAALAGGAPPKEETPAAQVFSTLPTTNSEARSIATMFRARDPQSAIKLMFGADGSASNLKKTWHDGVDVIHFATHGLADLRQPLTSLLLLPALDASGAPTYLTAGQVQDWHGDTDLVYLSACDTAVGRGMQGAFLRAGAHGVVATLWPVEDIYASQFAVDFYRRYTAGMPASQALSETQRAWMQPGPGIREGELPYRRMTAWAHAYFAQ